ncbi:conserved hypothetical protein [Leishmania major strain Friedlin]|uniref:Uncharacterized protein n=1 Tax=Leishmania major TaxID=5664 RepID=Q4QBI1_LEIMA|nr:conserved hypothetical protein [Leishmania major strain Friedlin]CAG9574033.1 hypothetical_protein_-_conserved [Leishmania major strain Friedlin]CAJ04933.1 conserved hypothetical protein [Leishmania major strain Friedlin]|eukprot:XP_001683317.1 conserved hypothetical protein [Leishmania major strain Friedlin]
MLCGSSCHEDSFLDAILDELTVNPYSDLPTVLARVERAQTAESNVERMRQRTAEQQEERAARLRNEWASATQHLSPASRAESQHSLSLEALTASSSAYLDSLARAADGEPVASLRGAPGTLGPPPLCAPAKLAAEALSPLTSALSLSDFRDEHASSVLRSAYVRLLPYILAVAAPPATRSTSLALATSSTTLAVAAGGGSASVLPWYAVHTDDSAVRELLSPYMSSVVGPLEKELRFHFNAGCDTAAVHEPQHFFSFLIECFQRQQRIVSAQWAASRPQDSESEAALRLLESVGQIVLSATAVVVFQECYGWRPDSALSRHKEYVVVTVNAVLDFVASAEGRLCRDSVQLLVEHLLAEEVLQLYAQCGAEMAVAALRDGAARLWRRSFLMEGAGHASFPLYTCSLHLVRSLEAFQRRLLNSLLLLRGSWAELVWRRCVEPALVAFLGTVEKEALPAVADAAAASWESVLSLQWCVASAQVVAAAAEDWLGMLRESCAATASTASSPSSLSKSETLDALMLFRDQLARRSAEHAQLLTRQLCTPQPGDAAQAARLLHGAEELLRLMGELPDSTSAPYVVQDLMQGVLQKNLSPEHKAELLSYTKRCGLQRFTQLLVA